MSHGEVALFACSEGSARMIRNSAISAIAAMMVAPAAVAIDRKTRSPHCPPERSAVLGGVWGVTGAVAPDRLNREGELTAAGSGLIVTTRSDHVQEIALIAVTSLSLKASGTGM